jgi:hypothetical protein
MDVPTVLTDSDLEQFTMTRSHLAESILRFEGAKFSLSDGYDIYKAIYNIPTTTLLLKNARQTGKTLSISNFIAIDSVSIPYIKSLYISPSQGQTTRFSHTKLMKVINESPIVKHFFTGEGVNNVFLKVARNLSEVTLSYAADSPDRIRGITSDRNYYDEVQDMDYANISSVADSCMDASQDPRKIISGTPKSMENPLEELWQRSSMTEALIRCEMCKVWNRPGVRNIGAKGFICAKCGRTLDVRNFVWRDFAEKKYRIKGFHIPQIIVPNHTENPVKWEILIEKFETYPTSKFKNEIMAESDSTGTRLITKDEILACCHKYAVADYPSPALKQDVNIIVAGVDWSGGGQTDETSRTTLWIWGVTPLLKFKTLFFKIYPIADPVNAVDDIATMCDRFGVRMVFGDAGEGYLANGLLATKMGRHRVGACRYGSFAKPFMCHPDTGVYMLDKTIMLDNYLMGIKSEVTIFPNSNQMETPIEDILSVFSETTNTGKKIWKRSLSKPDDCLHAQVFGWLAGKMLSRDLSFY